MEKRDKTAPADKDFTSGPAMSPTGTLIGWLNAQRTWDGKPKCVRLPVSLTLDEHRNVTRSALGDGDDAVDVRLNDTALGISLADLVRQKCKGARCALVVEARWSTDTDPLLGKGPRLDVLRVHDVLAPEALATARADVEIEK